MTGREKHSIGYLNVGTKSFGVSILRIGIEGDVAATDTAKDTEAALATTEGVFVVAVLGNDL
jgi:ethanolamine utilization protein EutA (predicted chaperonin)